MGSALSRRLTLLQIVQLQYVICLDAEGPRLAMRAERGPGQNVARVRRARLRMAGVAEATAVMHDLARNGHGAHWVPPTNMISTGGTGS